MRVVLSFLCLSSALAVQPMPDGTLVAWDAASQAGWSNYSYNVWRQVPPATNWNFLGSTNGTQFKIQGAVVPGTMFGVSSTAQSNAVFASGDIGVAAAPPDTNFGSGSLRLVGPVPALQLQSGLSAAGPWTTVAIYTSTPILAAAKTREFLRTMRTNLPPTLP